MNSERLPFLSELKEEMRLKGIAFKTVKRKEAFEYSAEKNDFLVTDCEEGANLARRYNTGYMYYEDPNSGEDKGGAAGKEFWDAECIFQGFDEVDADFVIKMYERSRNIPWTILETDRTIIRELVLEDIDDMYRLYSQPGVKDQLPALCDTKEEEVQFEKMYIRNMYGFYGYGIWTVLDKTTGSFIGRAGITHREGFEDLEVGYVLSCEYRNKGIGTEVMKAVISCAFERYGCERLNAFIHDSNIVSIRFAEKLGFVRHGSAEIDGKEMGWYQILRPTDIKK